MYVLYSNSYYTQILYLADCSFIVNEKTYNFTSSVRVVNNYMQTYTVRVVDDDHADMVSMISADIVSA